VKELAANHGRLEEAAKGTGLRIIIVSFFPSVAVAKAWSDEVAASAGLEGLPFPVLLNGREVGDIDKPDDGTALHRSFGFQRSVYGTWSPRALAFYATTIVTKGTSALRSSSGMDVHLMGGDILLVASPSSSMEVAFAHYSEESVDRPALETLLEAIRQAAASGDYHRGEGAGAGTLE
jgi:hypothetical protein